MKRVLASIGAFAFVQLLAAYILWAHGYNFDSRDAKTGVAAFFGALVGLALAAGVFATWNKK